jgi:uncharacterized protein
MIKGFSLSYSHGSAWLTVSPRQEGDRLIYSEEIRARMKILGIPPVRISIIEEVIRKASGEPVELVAWSGGQALSARASVDIDLDGMIARITLTPPRPGGEDITATIINNALNRAGVVKGIDLDGIDQMVVNPRYGQPFPIAHGIKPVHGKGTRVKYHFITQHIPYRELLFGRIDLKELNYIQNRTKGDLLAELLPKTSAMDGYTVTGEILPAEPADKGEVLIPGEGTQLDNNRLLAAWDGNARFDKGMVMVEPVVTVKNVDYETGNIDFKGSVVVQGTVADGFSVTAGGDIEVEKCVGRVSLISGRNILLKQGINGDNDAHVWAGGNVTAKYGEGCRIFTGSDLIIREALMHCTLMVKGNLLLTGGRAEMLGGTAVIRGSLMCRKLGGIYEPPTAVVIGIDPDDLEKYKDLLTSLEAKRVMLDSLDKKIGLLRKGTIAPESREKMQQAEKQLEEEAQMVNGEIREMVTRSHDMGRNIPVREESILAAEDRIYGGVNISFGFVEYAGNAGGKGVPSTVLSRHAGVIQDRGFDRANPPQIEPL